MADAPVRLGLALGGGAARGWAHVGVIRALEEHNIKPDLVSGTSIGALVGAALASQELDRLESWLYRLRVVDVISLMDPTFAGGLLKGERLMAFFAKSFPDRNIETLSLPFGAVATDLHTGAEVWLREGSTAEAVRASIALPGLFTPAIVAGRTLVDGGLVNPVPVSLARAMGADVVLAVDLNTGLVGRHLRAATTFQTKVAEPDPVGQAWLGDLPQLISSRLKNLLRSDSPTIPSLFDVIASSINIMQVRITRARLAGDPPDVVVSPKLPHLGLMEFHRAAEAIEEGYIATKAVMPQILECLSRAHHRTVEEVDRQIDTP